MIKVAKSADGTTVNAWYPDGQGNHYTITADGTYTITFRADGQGGEGWHEGFFNVNLDKPAETKAPATEAPATEAPVTEAPVTEAPATEAPATEAPATEAPATEAPATEAPATEAPATEAPVTEAPATEPEVVNYTYIATLSVAEKFSSLDFEVVFDDDVYDFVSADYSWADKYDAIINDPSLPYDETDNPVPLTDSCTVNVGLAADAINFTKGVDLIVLNLTGPANATAVPVLKIYTIASTSMIDGYKRGDCMPFEWAYSFTAGNEAIAQGSGSYEGGNVGDGYLIPATEVPATEAPATEAPATEAPATEAPATEAPATEAPVVEDYYLVGSMNGWAPDAAYKLADNKITVDLKKDDMIKVAKSADGTTVSDWYPDGQNNHYTITADGTYTITFRADGQGGEGWHEGFFNVNLDKPAETEAPATEAPATEAPATEAPATEAPATEAPKNYVYLTPNIWNQNAGERYEMYIWGDGKTSTWVSATKISDSKYQFEIPDGYTGGTFVREDPSKPAGDWNSKWNQTEDLTLTGNIGKTYTVNSWTGGKDGKSSGAWA